MDHISENQILPQNKNKNTLKNKRMPLSLIKLALLLQVNSVKRQLSNVNPYSSPIVARASSSPYLIVLRLVNLKPVSISSYYAKIFLISYSYLFDVIRNSHWRLRPFKLSFSRKSSAKESLHKMLDLKYAFKRRRSPKAVKKTKARRLIRNCRLSRHKLSNRKINNIQPARYNTIVWFNRIKKYSWRKKRIIKRTNYLNKGKYIRVLYNKKKRDRLFKSSLWFREKLILKRKRTKAYPLERKLIRNNLSFLNVLGFYSMSEPVNHIKESKVYHPWYKKSKNYRTSLFLSRHLIDFSRSILKGQLINKSITNKRSVRVLSYTPNLNTISKRVAMRYLYARKSRMLLKLKQAPRLTRSLFLSKLKEKLRNKIKLRNKHVNRGKVRTLDTNNKLNNSNSSNKNNKPNKKSSLTKTINKDIAKRVAKEDNNLSSKNYKTNKSVKKHLPRGKVSGKKVKKSLHSAIPKLKLSKTRLISKLMRSPLSKLNNRFS